MMAPGPSKVRAVVISAAFFSREQTRGARDARTHIILPDMHALTADSHCYIDSVVDEKRHTILLGDGMEPPPSLYQKARVASLVSVLHHRYASSESAAYYIAQVSVAEYGRRGVGD